MSLHERQVPIDVGDYPASAGTRVALIQDVDNIANRERKPKIQQHRKAPSTREHQHDYYNKTPIKREAIKNIKKSNITSQLGMTCALIFGEPEHFLISFERSEKWVSWGCLLHFRSLPSRGFLSAGGWGGDKCAREGGRAAAGAGPQDLRRTRPGRLIGICPHPTRQRIHASDGRLRK